MVWWRWQRGQRGSQVAITRAIASLAVMKESAKWRSGLSVVRTVLTLASGRGGKSAGALGDNEGKTAERHGDMVVPPAESPALEMIKT